MKTRWFMLVVFSSTLFCLGAGGADWPQWRGPGRDGFSHETGLLKEWPGEGPKLLWQLKDIGDGYGTPAVAGTRLYLLSNRGLGVILVIRGRFLKMPQRSCLDTSRP